MENHNGLVTINCRLPYSPKLSDRAKLMRKNMTPAEKRFWFEVLKSEKFKDYKFLRQYIIAHYIIDFYCAKFNLVVEIDGAVHEDQRDYDQVRTDWLENCGLRVIRFTNEAVMRRTEHVKDILLSHLQ